MAKIITRRSLILAAPALLLPRPAQSRFPRGAGASPFILQITYSPQALAAPQSFRDNVEAAANFYRASIFNPITVSFNVGYDEIWAGGYGPSPSNESQTLIWQEINNISYTTIRAALAALLVNSAVQTSFLSSLPVASSIGGVTNWSIMSSAAKMLNLWPAGQRNVADYDSTIGIGSAINPASAISSIIHEFGHALGRDKTSAGYAPHGFTRLTDASGTRPGPPSSSAVASYFSYDNGVTNLGDWEASAVPDNGCSFVNGTGGALWDPYCTQQNGAGTAQVLTALDKQYLECIGYHIA